MTKSKVLSLQRQLINKHVQINRDFEWGMHPIREKREVETEEVEDRYRRSLIQWKEFTRLSLEGLLWSIGSAVTSVAILILSVALIMRVIMEKQAASWLTIFPVLLGIVIYFVIFNQNRRFCAIRRARQLIQVKETYDRTYRALWNELQRNLAFLKREFRNFNQALSQEDPSGYAHLNWDNPRWARWSPARNPYSLVRLGLIESLIQPSLANILPKSDLPTLPLFVMPLGSENLLFKTPVEGKQIAIKAIQSLICRLLATQQPGKVLFTFIDANTIGQNAAPFMELETYNKDLVTEKIWVEAIDIERQLQNLTEHIERINRMYLGRGYSSLEEYHRAIGEVIEPYRILVAWDFPVHFSKEVAERLVSIASNGLRCGVSTIVLYDTNVPLPEGFDILTDLETGRISHEQVTRQLHSTGFLKTKSLDTARLRNEEQAKYISKLTRWQSVSNVFEWQENRFCWLDPDFEALSLRFDQLPHPALLEKIIKQVGSVSKDSAGLRVSFAQIMPATTEWWSGDAALGISIPIGRPLTGRIDRTRHQMLELGYEETLQHAFVGGMTGSGKSVSLRVLIANLALKYSPSEITLYLLDFKRVSFVPFVNYLLPHARVIAIESDREFALSVLREIYAEFTRRQECFADLGLESKADVDSVARYRQISGESLPRILFIADEIQVLISVDDVIKEEALRLLKDLAKQGRSFGIHIILATQTLTGSDMHEVSREFISQFGVRIAFKSSDEDGRRMLSDDNPLARDLRGKGHGIYNPGGGNKSANNVFQGANFVDEDNQHLTRMLTLAQENGFVSHNKQIIFKGYEPASLAENEELSLSLAQKTWPPLGREARIWLGEPIDIKNKTAILLKRENRSNIVLLGAQEGYAQGLLIAVLLALVAQHRPETAHFYILDFTGVSNFRHFIAGKMSSPGGHALRIVKPSELTVVVREIYEELETREQASRETGYSHEANPAIYLFFYGLPRSKDLQWDLSSKSSLTLEDAFKQLLSDGPALGIHIIVWSDRLNSLEKVFDLDEFDKRIVFQMPADDVREIVGERVAPPSKDRALLYSEDEWRLEKFRPYPLPSDRWLQDTIKALAKKS